MNKYEMRFELGQERLELVWDDEGMFIVTLGPKMGGTRCPIGMHCERAMGIHMFNHEAQAMQKKWEEET